MPPSPADRPVAPQDFNSLETRLIKLLERRSPVPIAGDDDQALYHRKHASPEFIRELAGDSEYKNFELPHCSRCTSVIVEAVNNVIARATANGNLAGRLDKAFVCYLPDKAPASEAHPTIIHARCTVDSAASPYMAQYVAEQIAQIPEEDIEESREGGYPTVLVIGTGEVVRPVYEYLRERFPNVEMAGGTPPELTLLEAYRLLSRDPRSRLGWRIALELDPPADLDELVSRVLSEELEFADHLPDGFSDCLLPHTETIRRLVADEEVSSEEQTALEEAVGMSIEQIRAKLSLDEDVESPCWARGSLRPNANARAARCGQPRKEGAGVTEAAEEGCGASQDGQDEEAEAEEKDRAREVARGLASPSAA